MSQITQGDLGHRTMFGEWQRLNKFQEYQPIYEGDRFCLMCGQACPVRRVLKSEATSPHGWALLVASVQRGMLQWNAETVDVLYRCADCGLCQGNCATDRPLPYALMAARAEVVQLGRVPANVTALDEKLRAWGNPYAANEPAPQANHSASPAENSIFLFVGDAAHFLKAGTVSAAEALLRATGVTSSRIQAGRSSGYLPYSLGLWDTARMLAQETVAALSGASQVVTLSPQDAHTLLHVYPELGVSLPAGLTVTTLVESLAAAHLDGKLNFKPSDTPPYVYHDAAQSVRLPGYIASARRLAAAVMGNPPRELLYREHLATPVGTSGGLEFTQPALAAALAQSRLAEIEASGATIVLTDDPMDTAQLLKYANGIQVWNLFERMAAQLK